MAMQSLQRHESSSRTHSLKNMFSERKLSQSHAHLPQECLSSFSRPPSSPSFKLQRGNHMHTQTRMSWMSPKHIHCLVSLAVTLEGTLFFSPQVRNSREPILCRLDIREFYFLKLLAVLGFSILKRKNLNQEGCSLIKLFHPEVQQKEKYV